ncbi:MAG: DUF6580 family putative transport protein [Pirellulales bacterium]
MSIQNVRLLTIVYFVTAVALRLIPHGWNISAVGALTLFAGCYLSRTQGIVIGLGAMGLSDLIGHWLELPSMGLYDRPTMFAVYACLAILPALLGGSLKNVSKAWSVPASAVLFSSLFFLVTNFAAWRDPLMAYPQTAAGLVSCYIAAVPFAAGTFAGDVLFSSAFFVVYALMTAKRPDPAVVHQEA